MWFKLLFTTFAVLLLVNLTTWVLANHLIVAKLKEIQIDSSLLQFSRIITALDRESAFLERWGRTRVQRLSENLTTSEVQTLDLQKVMPESLLDAADINAIVYMPFGLKSENLTVVGEMSGADHWNQPLVENLVEMLRAREGMPAEHSGLTRLDDIFFLYASVLMPEESPAKGQMLLLRELDQDTLEHLRDSLQAYFLLAPLTGGTWSAEPSVSFDDVAGLTVSGPVSGHRTLPATQLILSIEPRIVTTGKQMGNYYQAWIGGLTVLAALIILPILNLLQKNRQKQVKLYSELEIKATELFQARQHYQQIFDNAPLPMWLVDIHSYRYLDVNQVAIDIYGYTREQFLDMDIFDICPKNEVSRLRDSLPDALRQNGSAGLWRHQLQNGAIVSVEIFLSRVQFDALDARLVTAIDVTDKEKIRQTSDRISRLASLGELTAGVAHEINNPTGMILRNLDFIGEVLTDALPVLAEQASENDLQLGGLDYELVCDQLPQLLDDMKRGAAHIAAIVRDMKDFARFEEDSTEQSLFDVNQVVAAAVRLVDTQIRKTTDSFQISLAKALPEVVGSPRQIEQVVINLLLNACHALPDRQRGLALSTSFDAESRSVKVELADQGCGISKENLERIRDPFFTTRREFGGTGLGLSVSDRIVRQHHGLLNFVSELGQGTTVTLILPSAPLEK